MWLWPDTFHKVRKSVRRRTKGPATLLVGDKVERARYGTAADVWSFGAVLFTLLTLEQWLWAESWAECVARVARRLGPPPNNSALEQMLGQSKVPTDADGIENALDTFDKEAPGWPWIWGYDTVENG